MEPRALEAESRRPVESDDAGFGEQPRTKGDMRLIYLWDSEYPWDVRTQKICSSLTNAGCEVAIVARNRRGDSTRESAPEGEIIRMPSWRRIGSRLDALTSFPAFFNPRWINLLRRAIREWRPDRLIVRDLPLCPTALWVANGRVPVILDMAENYPAMIQLIWETGQAKPFDRLVRNPRLVAKVERMVLPKLGRIWVDVEEQRERLAALGVRLPPVDIVRNTPPVERVAAPPELRPRPDGFLLEAVYLGIVELQRGIGDMLRAAKVLRDRGTPCRVVIVGRGRDDAIVRRDAEQLGLGPDIVEFTGFLPHPDAMARLAHADVGVNPIHRNEKHDTTLPNKLFDYMALGLPVVTSDSVPSARVVKSSRCGEVFSSGDPVSLADALARLADPVRRVELGRNGQAAIRSIYHWERDFENALTGLRTIGSVSRAD
jgi:glycosyltransferase involved in cell wall biosynthesis